MIYREDHERDVMLQPKRSTWDSYVPSKSKTKVVMMTLTMRMRMMVVIMMVGVGVVMVMVGPLHALQGGIWGP